MKGFREIMDEGLEKYGLFYSLYPGIVTDNNDESKHFRLKVKVPGISNDEISKWALPVGIPNGDKYGFVSLPKIGSEVWIGFFNGNLECPYWQYGAFRENQQPDDITDQKTILVSANGQKVVVDDEDNSITLTQKDGFQVRLDENGIELKSANQNMNVELKNLFEWIKNAKTVPAMIGVTLPFSPDDLVALEQIKIKLFQVLKNI